MAQNADSGAPNDKVVDLMAALEASIKAAKEERDRVRAERAARQNDGYGAAS